VYSRVFACTHEGYARRAARKTRYGVRTCTSIRSDAAPSHELIIRHLYAVPLGVFLQNGTFFSPWRIRDRKTKKLPRAGGFDTASITPALDLDTDNCLTYDH